MAHTRPRRAHSPTSMYSGLAFLGLPPLESKKTPRPLASPKARSATGSTTTTRSVASSSTDHPSPSSSVFKSIRRSIVLSKSMEFNFVKRGRKGKEKASESQPDDNDDRGCASLKSPLSSRPPSLTELPVFNLTSPVISISKSPDSSSSSSGAGSPDTIWNTPSTSSASSSTVLTPPPLPTPTLPSVTIAIPEVEEDSRSRRVSSCTTSTTVSTMVFCYPDPDACRRRPTLDSSAFPPDDGDIITSEKRKTKPLLTLLSPPRLQKHARSSSTPSTSPSREGDKENIREAQEDEDECPPSPLIFAPRSSSDSDSDYPVTTTTTAFPELPTTLVGGSKKLGRSNTISHPFSNPNPVRRRRHVDLGAIEPPDSTLRQTGPGWTGKWNRRDMQDVIQSLRALK